MENIDRKADSQLTSYNAITESQGNIESNIFTLSTLFFYAQHFFLFPHVQHFSLSPYTIQPCPLFFT